MVFARRILCCLLICSPLAAQVVPPPTTTLDQLKGKIVFLRNKNGADTLSFDAQGNILSQDTPGSFAYSALKIEKIHRSSTEVSLKGNRIALVFYSSSLAPSESDIHYIPLKEPVNIQIALSSSQPGNLDAALQKIFALSLQDALSGKPPAEEVKDLDTLGSTALQDTASTPEPHGSGLTYLLPSKVSVPQKDVTPPRLIYSVTPAFTRKAKHKKITGICVLSTIVDTTGHPIHIRIQRPLDPGLDQNAMIAVSQYRFEPAIYQGHPAAVLINIEMNFRIW